MDKKNGAGLLIVGLLIAVGGLMIIYFAIFGSDDSDFPAGRFPAGLGGAIFLCGGLAVMLSVTPLRDQAGAILGSMIVTCFAAMFLLLCWRNARAESGIAFLPASWDQAVTRSITGLLGVGLTGFALICWFHTVRRIFGGRTGSSQQQD